MSVVNDPEFWACLASIVVITLALIMAALRWWFAHGQGRRDTPPRA